MCSSDLFGLQLALVGDGAAAENFQNEHGAVDHFQPDVYKRQELDPSGGIWEAGYCIGRSWWNRGLATDALKAVTAYWFSHTDGDWPVSYTHLDVYKRQT